MTAFVLTVIVLGIVALVGGLLAAGGVVWLLGHTLYRRPPNRPQFNRPPAVARHAALCRAAWARLALVVEPGCGRHRLGGPYPDVPAPRALEVPRRRDTALHDADTAELVVIDPDARPLPHVQETAA